MSCTGADGSPNIAAIGRVLCRCGLHSQGTRSGASQEQYINEIHESIQRMQSVSCEAVNRPAAAKAAMLNAGGSVSATTRLCIFSRLFGAASFVYHGEKKNQ